MMCEYSGRRRIRGGLAMVLQSGPTLAAALVVASLGPLRVTRAAAQGLDEFLVPTRSSGLNDITVGSDGNLWFTERFANQVGRITPDGAATEFPLAADSQPYEIAAGTDGNLWFTERGANQIGRITPDGVLTEFPLPTANSQPCGIANGPDGNVWFTECAGSRVGRVSPDGSITEFALAAAEHGSAIGTGPDGNVWFTALSTDRILRVAVASPNGITPFKVQGGRGPLGITTGPDGNLWFTEAGESGNRIGRMTPAGVLVDFKTPTENSLPMGITAGADGNLWFTERATSQIGRVTPSGAITEFPVHGLPAGITAGPDGAVWFVESLGDVIGRVTLPEETECPPTPAAGCRKPTGSQQAQLVLKNNSGKTKDSVSWSWNKGTATTFADFGDPINATGYAVCVYDYIGGTPVLVARAIAPAGGICAGKPCWKVLGTKKVHTGFQYKSPNAMLKIVMHAGDAGKAKITVSNAAANLPLPTFPVNQDPKVVVQLFNSAGTCWDADYGRPPIKSTTVQFKAKSD